MISIRRHDIAPVPAQKKVKTWWPAQSIDDVNDNTQPTDEVNDNTQSTDDVNDNTHSTDDLNNNTQSIDDVNFNTSHEWLRRVTDNENRSLKNKTSTTNCL